MSMTRELDVSLERMVSPMAPGIGYAALRQPHEEGEFTGLSFSPNPAYERYLLIHKVLVGKQGARQLEEIHLSLREEELPRYLAAAGSAATEAALVRTDSPTAKRMQLLDEGMECWDRSLVKQRELNANAPEWWVDNTGPFRAALNIAASPLLKGVILGYVPRRVCKEVFEDCLTIAQANAVRTQLMFAEGNMPGVGDHIGFGFECNALLGFNRRFAGSRFVIPSMVRSDSGHHHRSQTHDLSIIEQQRGEITQLTPIEIKATLNKRDKERYRALLVRGIMHLSVNESYRQRDTLDAITASYEGTATKEERIVADGLTARLMGMYRDYCSGDSLVEVASARTATVFRDNTQVAANYPGLTLKAA